MYILLPLNIVLMVVLFKKLISSQVKAADPRNPFCCGLFTLTTKFPQTTLPMTSLTFLVDTGSCLSILPWSFANISHSTRTLLNSNIRYIHTVFYLESVVHQLRWTFTVADTVKPILGANFFEYLGFLVGCKNHSIIPSTVGPPSFEPFEPNIITSKDNLSCATVFSSNIHAINPPPTRFYHHYPN